MKLIAYGKVMEDDSKTLKDYNLKDGDFVVVMVSKVLFELNIDFENISYQLYHTQINFYRPSHNLKQYQLNRNRNNNNKKRLPKLQHLKLVLNSSNNNNNPLLNLNNSRI